MIDTFDARAMRSENLRNTKFLELVCGPVELLVVRVVQMKAADGSMDRRRP